MNGVLVCLCLPVAAVILASAYPSLVDTNCSGFSNSNVTSLRDSLYQMSLDVDTLNVNYYVSLGKNFVHMRTWNEAACSTVSYMKQFVFFFELPNRCKCGDACSDTCPYKPTGIDPYFNYQSDEDPTCWIVSIPVRYYVHIYNYTTLLFRPPSSKAKCKLNVHVFIQLQARLYLDNQTLGNYEGDLQKLWSDEIEFDKLGMGLRDVISRITNLIVDFNDAVINLSCMARVDTQYDT